MKISIIALLLALPAYAQEPGFILNGMQIKKLLPSQPLLKDVFAHSRGLKTYEVQTLHYNRIACNRRIFSASGLSIEGDGDVKATNVPPDFIEVEFPTHVSFESFGAHNNFGNGISDMETVTSRELIMVRDWEDGKSLVFRKHMTLRFTEDAKSPQVVPAVAEMRVKDGTYPSTYIIRETIEGPRRFSLYYICQ